LINAVDLTKSIPDAPMITSFTILNVKKKPVNNFMKNEQGQLRFSSKTLAGPSQLPITDSTKVYYRKYKTSNWLSLPVLVISSDVNREGTIFSASLSPATTIDSAAIDLKIRIVDSTGNSTEQILSPAFSIGNWIDDGATPVEEKPSLPTKFALYQNYPNPFNPTTTIQFDIPYMADVNLVLYDILGRKVKNLINENRSAGRYTMQFNGSDLASGVYLLRLTDGHNTILKKMMLLK